VVTTLGGCPFQLPRRTTVDFSLLKEMPQLPVQVSLWRAACRDNRTLRFFRIILSFIPVSVFHKWFPSCSLGLPCRIRFLLSHRTVTFFSMCGLPRRLAPYATFFHGMRGAFSLLSLCANIFPPCRFLSGDEPGWPFFVAVQGSRLSRRENCPCTPYPFLLLPDADLLFKCVPSLPEN